MKLIIGCLWIVCLLCAANATYLFFIGEYGLAALNFFLSGINGLNASLLKEDE